ncbi:MAG: subclass B3 metallo-beta-lactamase [Erythrobacter sp.]
MFAKLLPLSLLASATIAQTACAPIASGQTESAPESVSGERDLHSSGIVQFSSECEKWDDWNKPAKPFQIHANTYYVGTCGIAAILITGGYAPVLIDTGTREGAETVLANIRELGVDPALIELILHSHEHFDHVGGLAFMQSATSAYVVASAPAADVFFGQQDPRDPQYGMHEPMQPVMTIRIVENGEKVTVGDIELIAIETPGHTPGALTWQWESCDDAECKTIVYADSLSPVSRDDYKFSEHPEYVAEYRAGIARIKALDCDILLTPHPSHSRMIERAATGTFLGGMTCAEYADGKSRDLDARLARETGSDQ